MLCQALFRSLKQEDWREMHEKLKEITRKDGSDESLAEGCRSGETGVEKNKGTRWGLRPNAGTARRRSACP